MVTNGRSVVFGLLDSSDLNRYRNSRFSSIRLYNRMNRIKKTYTPMNSNSIAQDLWRKLMMVPIILYPANIVPFTVPVILDRPIRFR